MPFLPKRRRQRRTPRRAASPSNLALPIDDAGRPLEAPQERDEDFGEAGGTSDRAATEPAADDFAAGRAGSEFRGTLHLPGNRTRRRDRS